ncbi:hypothetical protein SSAG_04914 [Streptomyces sp. Mg1]|nr:hypothetical protein SSAG_04914 [Streptomyces sp. Mg1]
MASPLGNSTGVTAPYAPPHPGVRRGQLGVVGEIDPEIACRRAVASSDG